MYAMFAVLVAVSCLFLTVGLPFRFGSCSSKILEKLKGFLGRRVLGRFRDARLYRPQVDEKLQKRWLRIWGVMAALCFVLFAIVSGARVQNSPESVAAFGFSSVLAFGTSTFLVVTTLAYAESFRWCVGSGHLKKCGFQRLWTVESEQVPESLHDTVASLLAGSSAVRILEVTGHEILGRGPGAKGGLLYDAIAAKTDMPISLLLLDPGTSALDPERLKATVMQTVLSELGTTAPLFRRRLQSTLAAVRELNQRRPSNAKIDVRLYAEKPTVTAVIFDDSALVSPMSKLQGDTIYTLHLPGRFSTEPSFFKVFRSHFARLWPTAKKVEDESALRAEGQPAGGVLTVNLAQPEQV